MPIVILLLFGLLWWASMTQAQEAKVIYLAPFDGAGTDASPFKPRGLDPSTGCIDRRPDPTQVTGWAICGRASLPAGTGYITLSSRVDATLNATQKSALETNLLGGAKLSASDLPAILAELLIDRAPAHRKLRQGKDGKYHIWLGGKDEAWKATRVAYDLFHLQDNGLLADAYNLTIEPVVAWATTLAQETFNCSDNGALTCVHTWTETSGTGWAIVSNRANSAITTASEARNDSTLATDDMQISATYIAHSRTGGGFSRCGVIGRKDGTNTRTYYALHADLAATGWETLKRVATTPTSLATNTQDPTANDVMRLEVDGSSVTGYVNSVAILGPTTDTDITGNLFGGVYSHSDGSAHSCTLDLWNGADVTAAITRRPQNPIFFP